MKKVLQVAVAVPAILFLVIGIRWIVDPAAGAEALGMPLLDGVGRSSQIGDMTAFFLSLSFMIFGGLITAKRAWFYAPVMMLGLAACFRIMAWLVHDAALAIPLIVPEIVIASFLLFASAYICEEG